jgi:dTDP-glucose 4,6-dehydratase
MKLIVTGGCGFIGSAVCRHFVQDLGYKVANIDKLTYAATMASTADLPPTNRYRHYPADICDTRSLLEILKKEQPDAIVHLAAESHVDRSIDDASTFVQTNVVGTMSLLNAALEYHRALPPDAQRAFRFHHVSTDEVYGDLAFDGTRFLESTPYAPRSPYSASKAASDHLVSAWNHTYGLPTLITNCSNNYGPYHFPEKLIPLMILNAFEVKPLPVYGIGENVRDWLYVEDHARAIGVVLTQGRVGETYNIGGDSEKTNLQVVRTIIDLIDARMPLPDNEQRHHLVTFVKDRPGHDRRYAIDCTKMKQELGWRARETFASGLAKTVDWYVDNKEWWSPLRQHVYAGNRLGQNQK